MMSGWPWNTVACSLRVLYYSPPDVGFEVTKMKIGKLGEEDRRER